MCTNPFFQVPFVQDKVYQEWLHADLRELATSCLPLQIQEQPSTTISGHFPLQVLSLHTVVLEAVRLPLSFVGKKPQKYDF